jgi:hypothetical protein
LTGVDSPASEVPGTGRPVLCPVSRACGVRFSTFNSLKETDKVSDMGCCGGDREKLAAVRAEQKWEYIVSIMSVYQSIVAKRSLES